jgi:diaminohydroxyphosphoribosylaminopyrimidine deaminase/5-amino-6-(5-phosphoribosylamino)uracil reductase
VSTPLDEHTAWNLVRAVPPGLNGREFVRVQHDLRPDVWLQVHGSGRWETAAGATPEAHDVLEICLPLLIRADVVIAQMGQSLDGRIATESGHSHYVTGPADIRRLHRLRALVDAVIVGAGTVASDNPRLTVRAVEGSSPVRVILDPDGRLDPDRIVFSDGAARTLVVRRPIGEAARPSAAGDLLLVPVYRNALAAFLPVSGADGFDPRVVLEMLRDAGYRRVLIEGGGITVSRFVQAGVVDRLHVTVAPLLIGSGRPALTLAPIQSLDQALRPRCRHFRLGEDILFDLDLRASSQ